MRPKTPLLRSSAFGALCISLQPLLLSAIMLPATAYVIRGLGATGYGEWATAATLVAVVTVLTNLGLRGTFVRSVARDPESAAHAFADQIGVRLALSLLAAIIAVFACLLLQYSTVVLYCTLIGSAGLVLFSISTTAADLLQAFHRLTIVAAANLIAGVVVTAASIVVVWAGAGPTAVAAAYLLGPATSAAVLIGIIHKRHLRVRVQWDLRRNYRLLQNGRYFAAQQLLGTAAHNIESLLLPRLLGPTAFGFFSGGALLANRLVAIPDGISSVAYPIIANESLRGRRAVARAFVRFLALSVFTCIILSLAVTVLAGPISRLLFPNHAAICERVMRITIWLLPFMGAAWITGAALNGTNREAAQAKASLASTVCGIIVSIALIWRFGLIGACWSMVIRYAIHLIALAPLVREWFRPTPESVRDLGVTIDKAPANPRVLPR